MRFYYQFSFVLGSQIHQHRVLEASWGCLEGVLGVFGGASWNDFGANLLRFWLRRSTEILGASCSVLGCLGASWGRLGLDFRSNIVTYYLGCHFLTVIRPILHPKIDPRSLNNH